MTAVVSERLDESAQQILDALEVMQGALDSIKRAAENLLRARDDDDGRE